jgi:small subunit ribosomal protein S4e
MHLKRQGIPKSWPVYRKGTKYVINPRANLEEGVPLLVALRDFLKIVQNRKEAKRAIFLKQILLNNKIPKKEKNFMLLFDTLTIVPSKESYRLELSDKGKFQLIPIKANEANKKVSKIKNKKILKGKKGQLNLRDGRNLISNLKSRVNDSALINFNEKKIEKIIPLKENAKVSVFAGKHAGKKGIIKKMDTEKKSVELSTDKNEKINVLIKQIIVIE